MSDSSPRLGLPYIMPAQAQKHVTHNEAIRALDALVQLAVQSRGLTAPPASPAEGARHLVAPGATGDWAGRDHAVALYEAGVWRFFAPVAGWVAEVLDEGIAVVFDGAAWAARAVDLEGVAAQNMARLGVGATADAINRLSVAAPATLLSHDDSGGDHRVKINKAAAADTASLMFQSGFTGHAEMGLTGGTGFALRVSADGSAFADALRAEPATGRITLPAGLSFGAQTLAHYQTGSWTPTLSFGGSSAGITYGPQVAGVFTRIGNMVMLQCAMQLTARGTATGAAAIGGLPFPAAPAYHPGEVVFTAGGAGLVAPKCRILPGPRIGLVNSTASGTTDLTHANFTASTNLKISLLHFV